MTVAALVLLPVGVLAEGTRLWQPRILLIGTGVAILSSALPYSLELAALRRLPVNVFGVLLSLEPAIAACISFVVLGERLTTPMMAAIALVSIAAAAISRHPPPSNR